MQPSSVSQTFDASVLDLQRSFSSTDTNTTGSSSKENMPLPPSALRTHQDAVSTSAADKVLSNESLYDKWASTYDTDGNVLVAVDTLQMQDMIPALGKLVTQHRSYLASINNTLQDQPLRILDLGCGTGRNTLKILQEPWAQHADIEAWDLSQGMLEVARATCQSQHSEARSSKLSFHQKDFSTNGNIGRGYLGAFDVVVSTLVLEHLPASNYFTVLSSLLTPGGYALVTNMHNEMGSVTRAGYKTESGERVKGSSYVHTVESTVRAAGEAGLDVVDAAIGQDGSIPGVCEVAPSEGMVGPRGEKWIGVKIWYGMMLRRP